MCGLAESTIYIFIYFKFNLFKAVIFNKLIYICIIHEIFYTYAFVEN